MAFQFQCPHQHLLEGEESQAGQTINCPVCGVLFIIPPPIAATEPEQPVEPAKPIEPEKPAEPEFLHIPCPNGHELEVPPEMLDTEVLCPHCKAQFRLRAKDSMEHRRARELQEQLREAKTNKFWYQFSIGTVIAVVLLLGTLMLMSALNKPTDDEAKPKKKKKAKPAAVEKTKEPSPEPTEDEAATEKMKED